MYKDFEDQLKRKGLTIYRVAKDCDINAMSLYDWKNGKSVPKYDKMLRLAVYLDVPVLQLMKEGD